MIKYNLLKIKDGILNSASITFSSTSIIFILFLICDFIEKHSIHNQKESN